MRPFPFISRTNWFHILRIVLGLLMTAHGVMRILDRGIRPFGEFLSAQGFPDGVFIAWAITLFEIAGGITLAMSFLRRPICVVFIFELLMGILLVHASNGWFVVGYTTGGIEYNALLIVCFLTIASED